MESLARRYQVPIDQLMEWNGIAPGQELDHSKQIVIFELPEVDLGIADADEDQGGAQAASTPKPRPRPRPKARTPSRAPAQPVMKIEAAVVSAESAPEPVPGRVIQVNLPANTRVGAAGVLGALDDADLGSNDGLADAASNMENRRGTDGGLGLKSNNRLGGGGTAENLDHVADTKVLGHKQTGVHGDTSTIRVPRLSQPSPKRCLSGPSATDLKSDDGYLTSKGLTASQVRSGMARIVRYTLQCFPRGTRGSHTVTVEVTAGCDGLVDNVWLANSGGLPAPITSCITQTVGYASFPAHDLPDGALFQYPIQYRF